jgi:hypothetical protein
MKKNIFIPVVAVLVLVMAMAFQNCGGGGGGGGGSGATGPDGLSPGIAGLGVFMDDPVVGVHYTTSSGISGVTNSLGQFQFNPGDTVTFSALGVSLGSVTPTINTDGTATVTPMTLVPGATDVTDPQVTAIAQFLNTLNVIAVADGDGATGVFTMPDNTDLQTQLAALGSGAGTITEAQLQAVLNSVFGSGQFTVTAASTAQSDLQEGINSLNIAGTVWRANCTCEGGAYLYFSPNGIVKGFTDDGGVLTGSWSVAGDGSINATASAHDGGHMGEAHIPAGSSAGTGNAYDENNNINGTLTLTKITSASQPNANIIGVWYVNYTPNAAGLSMGQEGGSALLMVAPGGFYGISDGREPMNGSITSTGKGSFTFFDGHDGDTRTTVLSLDFANSSASITTNGVNSGTLTLSRTGSFTPKPKDQEQTTSGGTTSGGSTSGGSTSGSSTSGSTTSGTTTGGTTTTGSTDGSTSGDSTSGSTTGTTTGVDTTSGTTTGGSGSGISTSGSTTGGTAGFLVHLIIHWQNGAQDPDSMNVTLNILDENNSNIGHALSSESSNGNHNGNSLTTEDNIVANYPSGLGKHYQIVPSGNCHVASGGSGDIFGDSAGSPAIIDCP